MRTFCKSLYGDSRSWFKHLEAYSIGSWTDFRNTFLRYWGENKSYDQYIFEFYSLKRKKDEVVIKFNKRFHRFYLSMPKDIQPFETVAM